MFTVVITSRLDSQSKFHSRRVVRKPVNVNPGLNVNESINFSCIRMFFTAYVLCSFIGL